MYISSYWQRRRGFTFIELMVALVVNIVVLGALMYVMTATIKNYNFVVNVDTLNQQLQMSLDLMANDIRRAGYWSNASSDIGTVGQNSNPFMASGTDISVNASNNCILFTYDHDSSGTLPAINAADDDARYGFRLSGQVLQTRPPGAAFSCGAAVSAWENVTDPSIINITALSFVLNTIAVPIGSNPPDMVLRTVTISITGRLVSNSSVTKTLTQVVRVRNDKYIP